MKQFKDFKNLSIATLMAAALFTACSNDDNSIVDKPTLGSTVTWNINTQGNAIVPDGEKWIIQGNGKKSRYKIVIGDGATVTLSGVNIEAFDEYDSQPSITCLGDATIILDDRTTNILNGYAYPGIVIPTDKKKGTLTIKGTGSLEARSDNGTGIGCPYGDENIGMGVKMDCGNIVIESGNIIASGFGEAAGIGSSGTNKCGNITIKGGNVTAIGGFGPGIGNFGKDGACGDILITGGVVTSSCGGYNMGCPGIGSCWGGSCGSVTITDQVTKVTVTGDSNALCSIGGESNSWCGRVTIGGTVYWDGRGYQNGGETFLAANPFVYEP